MAEDGYGCHGEDCAYGSAVAPDTVKLLLLTAVLVQGHHIDQSGRHLAVEMPLLRQFGGEHGSHHGAIPGHAALQPDLVMSGWKVAQPGLGFPVQVFGFGLKPVPDGSECGAAWQRMRCPDEFLPVRTWRSAGVVTPRAHVGARRSASGRGRTDGIRYAGSLSCRRTAAQPSVIPVRAAISVVAHRTGTIETMARLCVGTGGSAAHPVGLFCLN